MIYLIFNIKYSVKVKLTHLFSNFKLVCSNQIQKGPGSAFGWYVS